MVTIKHKLHNHYKYTQSFSHMQVPKIRSKHAPGKDYTELLSVTQKTQVSGWKRASGGLQTNLLLLARLLLAAQISSAQWIYPAKFSKSSKVETKFLGGLLQCWTTQPLAEKYPPNIQSERSKLQCIVTVPCNLPLMKEVHCNSPCYSH